MACALARNTSWSECDDRVREMLQDVGSTQARADALFALTAEAFRTDPWKLVTKLSVNLWSYLQNLPHNMLVGHDSAFPMSLPTASKLSLLLVPGVAYYLIRGARLSDVMLWVGLFVAIALSAMIMYHHDGWRTLYATHPLLAVMFALGFANPLPVASQVPPIRPSRVIAFAVITAVALVSAPALVRAIGEASATASPPGTVLVHGGAMVIGFVVVPDDAPPLTDAPSLPRSASPR